MTNRKLETAGPAAVLAGLGLTLESETFEMPTMTDALEQLAAELDIGPGHALMVLERYEPLARRAGLPVHEFVEYLRHMGHRPGVDPLDGVGVL